MNKAKPPVLRIPGASCLVLTALAHQAVKPLAEIVCNYFCCDSLEKSDEVFHRVHLLSATGGSEKGRSASITQALTQYNKTSGITHHRGFAFSMIHREFGKLSAIQQKNVQNMQSLPSWQSLKSSCFRQNLSVCQMIQVIITLESAKAGKLRCCQRQLLILITVIGNYVLFLHA